MCRWRRGDNAQILTKLEERPELARESVKWHAVGWQISVLVGYAAELAKSGGHVDADVLGTQTET